MHKDAFNVTTVYPKKNRMGVISSLKREHLGHQAVGFVLFGVRLSLIIKGWRPFG